MRRNAQRLFDHIEFLGPARVLQTQITETVIVKVNSKNCRRASCALGVHVRSRVSLFEFQQCVCVCVCVYVCVYVCVLEIIRDNHADR